MKGPTKIPLSDIVGIIYGGTSMTFTMHKKQLIRKMRKKRKYRKNLNTHFTDKQEVFENFDDVEETSYGDKEDHKDIPLK